MLGILFARYDSSFVLITLASLSAYVVFTIKVSNWRIAIRRKVNDTDSAANTRAIDSLLNYETVKYFNNEEFEARRYDQQMQHWEDAATRSQVSLSWLNLGQQIIIALGVELLPVLKLGPQGCSRAHIEIGQRCKHGSIRLAPPRDVGHLHSLTST